MLRLCDHKKRRESARNHCEYIHVAVAVVLIHRFQWWKLCNESVQIIQAPPILVIKTLGWVSSNNSSPSHFSTSLFLLTLLSPFQSSASVPLLTRHWQPPYRVYCSHVLPACFSVHPGSDLTAWTLCTALHNPPRILPIAGGILQRRRQRGVTFCLQWVNGARPFLTAKLRPPAPLPETDLRPRIHPPAPHSCLVTS